MEELIKRLEKASGPDRLLDDAIANELGLDMPDDPAGWPLRYTALIDAALTLVPENAYFNVERTAPGKYAATRPLGVARIQARSSDIVYGIAETPAIALCIAALRAR